MKKKKKRQTKYKYGVRVMGCMCVHVCVCAGVAAWLQGKHIPDVYLPNNFLPSIPQSQVPVFPRRHGLTEV